MESESGRGSSYKAVPVVAWGLPDEIGTLSLSISAQHARNIREAVPFASVIKLPLDWFVTIQWSRATSGGRPQDRLLRFFERAYQWLFRRNLKLAYVDVHEIGSLRGLHTHVMLHMPIRFRKEFERMIPQWIDSPSCDGLIEVKPVEDRDRLVDYFLKGTEREAARALGILRCSDEGKIRGKRCGTSENIGRKARNQRSTRGRSNTLGRQPSRRIGYELD
jgi:hypothetical protein